MGHDNWTDGYNAGVVAVAAHLRRKADLFREFGEGDNARSYCEMVLAALQMLKPTGLELTTIETTAGPLTVNRQGEADGD